MRVAAALAIEGDRLRGVKRRDAMLPMPFSPAQACAICAIYAFFIFFFIAAYRGV